MYSDLLLADASHPVCLPSPTAIWANVFLLALSALVKVGFTAWTFGMMVSGWGTFRVCILTVLGRFRPGFSCRPLLSVHAWDALLA